MQLDIKKKFCRLKTFAKMSAIKCFCYCVNCYSHVMCHGRVGWRRLVLYSCTVSSFDRVMLCLRPRPFLLKNELPLIECNLLLGATPSITPLHVTATATNCSQPFPVSTISAPVWSTQTVTLSTDTDTFHVRTRTQHIT